jgi:hypothetical protein
MKNKKELTIEKLRTFPGNEHHTEEEAKEIIISIRRLTSILYELYKSQNEKAIPCKENKE